MLKSTGLHNLNKNLGGIQDSQTHDVIIAQTNNDAFISNVRIVRRLWRVKVYIKDIGLWVIVKASFLYKICLGHLIFRLPNFDVATHNTSGIDRLYTKGREMSRQIGDVGLSYIYHLLIVAAGFSLRERAMESIKGFYVKANYRC